MKPPRLTLSIFALVVSVAAGQVQPLEDAPSVLSLSSGAEVEVLQIFRTTLIETDEPALVLRYPTSKIKEELCSEAEEVWAAFRPIVEKEKLRAAVISGPTGQEGLRGSGSKTLMECGTHRAKEIKDEPPTVSTRPI
jgi:hypothetical protein